MRNGGELRIPAEKLRYVCNPKDFDFQDTSKIEPIKGFIGQERAVEALGFGLGVNNRGYDIFATGHTGKGKKKGVICDFLENIAKERAALDKVALKDVCYIYNFGKPEQPRIVFLDRGRGGKFKRQMAMAFESLKRGMPHIFLSEEYLSSKESLLRDFEEERRHLSDSLREKAKEAGFILTQLQEGCLAVDFASRVSASEPMKEEEYNALPDKEKKPLDKKRSAFEKLSRKVSREMHDLKAGLSRSLDELDLYFVGVFFDNIFKNLYAEYGRVSAVLDYFGGLKQYVLDNVSFFNPTESNNPQSMADLFLLKGNGSENTFLPFAVNLFVDNGGRNSAPVIFESNPSFHNLFCRIEKKAALGSYFTDHTCLKSGSLALANGGYLILNIRDILENPGVWEKLKKTLRQGILELEEPLGLLGIASLSPEPMPVNLKVIVIGEPYLYHLLVEYDPDFLSVFKVKAEFDSEMPLTLENKKNYAGFISLCCKKENLLPFDASGAGKVVEYGTRLADSQKKLSTKFDEIKDLIIESSYWAAKSQSLTVKSEHVRKALESQRLRLNLTEEKISGFIKDGVLLIDTEGKEIGQVNGLVVYDFGDYSFGRPSRITARTFVGEQGVISIDREAKMSGSTHNKGVLILKGYFGEKYGKLWKISFSASLCFEQSYHGVDGDSASAAELICLISSLSGLPISQSIAITGSCNQFGRIQPIGRVNEKIEGFFDVCKERGLTGEQGVIIPDQNVQNLSLKEEIVESVKSGKFSIYAIKNVDEGIEILMKTSADRVDQKVRDRLREKDYWKSKK